MPPEYYYPGLVESPLEVPRIWMVCFYELVLYYAIKYGVETDQLLGLVANPII